MFDLSEIVKIPNFLAAYKTGSNYTVDPPVTDTDIDYLVLIESDDTKKAISWLIESGWDLCDHRYDVAETGNTVQWFAVRKDNVNLIIQNDLTLYIRSCAATELCKALNVKNKEDRIKLFRAVKFGAEYGVDNDKSTSTSIFSLLASKIPSWAKPGQNQKSNVRYELIPHRF